MNPFSILEPFFNALSNGRLLRSVVAWVLRILSALIALATLLGFFKIIQLIAHDQGSRDAKSLLAGLLVLIVCLVWGYVVAGVFAYRARSVAKLEDSHFSILSILSLLFRLNGEVALVSYTLLGMGGCLFVWITGATPSNLLGLLPIAIPFAGREGEGFLSGIGFCIVMLLVAFAAIVLFYALAELTVVLVEIAQNTARLKPPAEPAGPSPVPAE